MVLLIQIWFVLTHAISIFVDRVPVYALVGEIKCIHLFIYIINTSLYTANTYVKAQVKTTPYFITRSQLYYED